MDSLTDCWIDTTQHHLMQYLMMSLGVVTQLIDGKQVRSLQHLMMNLGIEEEVTQLVFGVLLELLVKQHLVADCLDIDDLVVVVKGNQTEVVMDNQTEIVMDNQTEAVMTADSKADCSCLLKTAQVLVFPYSHLKCKDLDLTDCLIDWKIDWLLAIAHMFLCDRWTDILQS